MKTVLWQTRSEVLFDSVQQGRLLNQANGGNTYDFHAIQSLQKGYRLRMDHDTVKRREDNKYEHAFRLFRTHGKADIVVKEASIIALGPLQKAPVEIGLIHHIDDELMKKSRRHQWFFNRLMRRLPKLDVVVTVSTYWKEKLHSLGCKNVEVIYNSFDVAEFDLSDNEVQSFLERHQMPLDKPIIYIGGAGARKGAERVYEELKDKGYYLVVTGPKKEIDIPVRWLNLDRQDYLCLLRACSLVMTMSTMPEGWNRVAHEAMLCGTPVIGSGIGGMEELLFNGGQQIVKDFADLDAAVQKTLEHPGTYSRDGIAYARRFDMEYFKREWIQIIHSYATAAPGHLAPLAQLAE